ncbi:MAG: hypothetical protein IKU50_02835 [Bacteroidaceae bacterium]|nr:hypothetical protein [Bacteroidaceae bacterium]
MSANYLELVKQVDQQLEPIIEKIDSLEFCPFTWDESYHLLRELETAVEQIDNLSEQLEPIFFDDVFWNDVQNKAIVENVDKVLDCFELFSWHFGKIDGVLHDEGPREDYTVDYEYLSAQLKKAKQHLDQILL